MFNATKFAEMLTELMAEQNLNPPALALALHTDRSNVTRYLSGKQAPSFKVFVAIIEYFNVSADVILGLKDYSTETYFIPVENFGLRLRQVMKETSVTQYKIEKDLKLSGASMYNWLSGKSLPSVSNLLTLSNYMEISVDYLLGRIT